MPNPRKGKPQPVPAPVLGRGGKPIARNRDGSPVTFRMRICYQKQGRAAMLSHLEVTRALERVIRRAGLPYAITNGFSPHMRASFGSALPVGVGSTGEYLDVLLVERIPEKDALAALKAARNTFVMIPMILVRMMTESRLTSARFDFVLFVPIILVFLSLKRYQCST